MGCAMRFLFSLLIWMLLAQQVYTSIEKHPEIWGSPSFWATLLLFLGILAAIQFKFIYDQMESKFSGENANLKSQIELLKQQSSELNSYESILKSLKENDIKTLKLIDQFQKQLSAESISHYSVEQLEEELGEDSLQANGIIKKLKRLDLVTCYWENVLTFPSITRPLNEEKPVRLTKLGQEFILLHNLKANS